MEPTNMHILLALIFAQLIVIEAKPSWENVIYKTKVSFYKKRGQLQAPTKLEDYCRRGLCPEGVRHIACNNPFWGPQCSKPRSGLNMDKFKYYILSVHNNLRTRLHRKWGELPAAKRIPLMTWNEELSVLAMRVTNFCNDDKASQCVNTPRFIKVARNSDVIQYAMLSERDLPTKIVNDRWARQYKNFPAAYVANFPENISVENERFANMAYQKATRVGCGILVREEVDKDYFHCYMTCLYDYKIKPGSQLYTVK